MTKEQFIGWFNAHKASRCRGGDGRIVYTLEHATFTQFKNLCKEAALTYEWQDDRAVAEFGRSGCIFYSRLIYDKRYSELTFTVGE